MERHFSFNYDVLGGLLKLMGLGPPFARIDVGPYDVNVRFGWAFQARIPRRSIVHVEPTGPIAGFGSLLMGWGVHTNFAGTWFVNGAQTNLVAIELAEQVRGRTLFLPVWISRLVVSVEDPGGLLAALR
jgi:hypothetical protein